MPPPLPTTGPHNDEGMAVVTCAPDRADEAIVAPATYGDEHRYHDLFRTLRAEDPVHWCEPADYRPFWAVTRHADIMEIEFQPRKFVNDPRQFLVTRDGERLLMEQTGGGMFARNLVAMDDPDHKTFRALTAAWFGQKRIRGIEAEIDALAEDAIARMVDAGGECDFARDVAAWYPLRTIMTVLGVPREDEAMFLRLTQKIFGSTDADTGGGEGMGSMLDAFREFSVYFDRMTAERRERPRDDVATILSTATIDGRPIGDAERNAYYLIIAAAGHDTTSSAISGGLLALVRHPQQQEKLRADPALMPKAVDEFVRWTTPVKHFFRTATEDYTLRGKRIRAGDSLMMCYPSANRDEAEFDAPFEFRVDRTPNRHLAFGYGPHLCLGQYLAKLEMRTLFGKLLARFRDFELAGDPAWVEANFVSGLKRLPIRYRAA